MRYRNDDMLYFIALGDAAGVGTEFVRPDEFPELIARARLLQGYVAHPRHLEMQPGCYSDDTQMSIAVAEVIAGLRHSTGIMPNARDFVDAFVRVYKRDRRSGYSKAFQVFLDSVVDTDDFIKRIQANVSEKNGSAMRAVPIGALPHPGQVLVVASIQARTTHNTYMGRFGSRAIALMSHFALYESAGFDKLYEFLMDYLREEINALTPNLRTRKRGPVLQPVPNTIHAVFDLLTHSDSLFDVLRKAITMGGDTDTVAAIAVGIASARMPKGIPQVMFDTLEQGRAESIQTLKSLGKKLMETYA